jgi:hypothetical protein
MLPKGKYMENGGMHVVLARLSDLKFYSIFFEDREEEMMRNASCYVILFLVNN